MIFLVDQSATHLAYIEALKNHRNRELKLSYTDLSKGIYAFRCYTLYYKINYHSKSLDFIRFERSPDRTNRNITAQRTNRKP